MLICKPDYYDRFRCIASRCPDSCCKEWDVQVDDASAAYYRSLPGPLGDRLREVLSDVDGETVMTITEGRCPMWRDDGLCRIQAELGEDALCGTCREFPRLTHDYGDFLERGLELSCPEAAKFILEDTGARWISQEIPGGEEPEYDEEAMALLKASRGRAMDLLMDTARPIGEVLACFLLYGYQAQAELDGAEILPFDPDSALDSIREQCKVGDLQEMLAFFQELEILTPEWETLLQNPVPGDWDSRTLALARYLVQRYWLQAVSDYDLYSRVKFIVLSCLLVKALGGNFLRTAQLFSKEIENDADNIDALLDGAYSHSAFTDDKVLGMLLEG